MDLELAGKVYIVTGATRGLGFATARELVAEGLRSDQQHVRGT